MTVTCFCGKEAKLANNRLVYGRSYGNGLAYICEGFETCRGYVGAHNNGKPLGTIVDKETKKLRMKIHSIIDPMWGRDKHRRGSVYKSMRKMMGMTRDFHVGELSKEDSIKCLELLSAELNIPDDIKEVL